MAYDILDEAILEALPIGSQVVSVIPHGSTRWSVGLKVDVFVPPSSTSDDEKTECFFLKIIERKELLPMAEGEYESQKTLAQYIPDNVVAPLAWGNLKSKPHKSFFMTKFYKLQPLPSPPPRAELLSILKKLHTKSQSPTGKFGFHVTTYFGPPPLVNEWTDNWEHFFRRQWISDAREVQKSHGLDAELMTLSEQFVERVVARLLRPLQAGGRNIKPVLCHGDLWDGNIMMETDSERPILFDGVCLWGHNEMDLQCMGGPQYALGMDFIELYKTKIGASEPKEDFYDRHRLYAMRTGLVNSLVYVDMASTLIQKCKDDMRDMLRRFPQWVC